MTTAIQIKKPNLIIRAFRYIIPERPPGTPCYIIGKEASYKYMVPARQLENISDAIRVRTKWIDDTNHSFLVHQDDYIFTFNNIPVYAWNVGSCFAISQSLTAEFVRPDGSKTNIGSEYLDQLLDSDVGVKYLHSLDEFSDNKPFPWLKWIIVASVVVLIIYLAQNGYLSNILNQVFPGTKSVAEQQLKPEDSIKGYPIK